MYEADTEQRRVGSFKVRQLVAQPAGEEQFVIGGARRVALRDARQGAVEPVGEEHQRLGIGQLFR